MKTAIQLACIGFTSTMMSNISFAAVLLSDNFDGYANQAAFEAAWIPNGTVAPISATLATDQASSPSKSIRVDGTLTTGQQRNQRSFTESGIVTTTTVTVFSFDFYDSDGLGAAPYRQFSEIRDGAATATGQIVAMGLNNNQGTSDSGGNFYMARILGYTPTLVDPDGGPNEGTTLTSGMFFKLNDFTNVLRSTGWHNLMVEIGTDDGLSADFAFYVDGTLAERVNNVGTAAQLRSYDSVRLGSGVSNANNAAYYDNFSVQVVVVPEPSAIGLSLMGALAFACRRRRLS